MEELLEELASKLKKELLRHSKWTELTVVSLNTGKDQGVVVTNKAVYLFRKGLFGIKTTVIPLGDIKEVQEKDNLLILQGKVRHRVVLPKNRNTLAGKVKGVIKELGVKYGDCF